MKITSLTIVFSLFFALFSAVAFAAWEDHGVTLHQEMPSAVLAQTTTPLPNNVTPNSTTRQITPNTTTTSSFNGNGTPGALYTAPTPGTLNSSVRNSSNPYLNQISPQLRNNAVNPNTYRPYDTTNTYGTNTYRAQSTTTNNATNWSWIGLLGLVGLAGLFGRNRERID